MSCIFCKIAGGEISSHKIWEDEEHIAFLDAFPNIVGQAVVTTKEHMPSDYSVADEKKYLKLMYAAKEVAKLMKEKMKLDRVGMIVEGLGVDHLHVKLYPIKKDCSYDKERIIFEQYSGFLTTKLGPKADDEELKKIAKKFEQSS